MVCILKPTLSHLLCIFVYMWCWQLAGLQFSATVNGSYRGSPMQISCTLQASNARGGRKTNRTQENPTTNHGRGMNSTKTPEHIVCVWSPVNIQSWRTFAWIVFKLLYCTLFCFPGLELRHASCLNECLPKKEEWMLLMTPVEKSKAWIRAEMWDTWK